MSKVGLKVFMKGKNLSMLEKTKKVHKLNIKTNILQGGKEDGKPTSLGKP